MEIIIITGRIGAGKTLYMSYLAHELAKEKNANIVANYAIEKGVQYPENSPIIVAVDEINIFRHFLKDLKDFHEHANRLVKGITYICTTTKLEFIEKDFIPKNAKIINVEKVEDCITTSEGELIKISEENIKYDALKMPSDYLL